MHAARYSAHFHARPSGRTSGRHDPLALAAAAARQRLMLIGELRKALAHDTLGLGSQPVIGLQDGQIDHHALQLNWDTPAGSPIAPDALFQLAEGAGLAMQLGDWMFERAAALLASAPAATPLSLAVSPLVLQAPEASFTRWLDRLDTLGLDRDRLVLSVAEPTLGARADTLLPVLDRLCRAGLQIAFDHVGAAASLGHLQQLGARSIQIDRDMLRDIEHDAPALALCEGLIERAHKLGLPVIADGIESPTRRAVLEAVGCDLGQGRLLTGSMHG